MDGGASIWVPAIVSAVSAAAGGAGTYSAAKANKQEIESRDQAARIDRNRQEGIQEEADAKLRREVAQFSPETAQQQVDIAAATRTAAAPPVAAPAQYQATPSVAPVEVKNDADRRLTGVATKAQEEASRRARLAAYGDVSQQQGFQIGRLGESFRQMGADSRGSTNLMRAEAQLPATAAQGQRNRSDIANTIGAIGSLYAGRKPGGSIGYGSIDPTQAGSGLPY